MQNAWVSFREWALEVINQKEEIWVDSVSDGRLKLELEIATLFPQVQKKNMTSLVLQSVNSNV